MTLRHGQFTSNKTFIRLKRTTSDGSLTVSSDSSTRTASLTTSGIKGKRLSGSPNDQPPGHTDTQSNNDDEEEHEQDNNDDQAERDDENDAEKLSNDDMSTSPPLTSTSAVLPNSRNSMFQNESDSKKTFNVSSNRPLKNLYSMHVFK
jgi:hypothetical protein